MEGGKVRRRVEQEFDCGINQVLEEVGKDYKKLQNLADALGVSYQVLTYWIEKYLGVKKEDFYKKVVCKSNCLTIRVNGDFRYKVDNQLKCNCKCRVGVNCLIAKVSEADLLQLCAELGGRVSRQEEVYVVSF